VLDNIPLTQQTVSKHFKSS